MPQLAVLLLLGLLILIHELGHLFAARAARIPIARFSVGFGPALWRRVCSERWGRMELRLGWLPLGGYVMPDVTDERDLFEHSLASRVAFYLGGPLANLAFALPLFAIANVAEHGFSVHAVAIAPWAQVVDVATALIAQLPTLLSEPGAVSGVVGIVVEGGRFVAGSVAHAATLCALLTLNLAIFNLLPIPVLDGGKILLHLLHSIAPRTAALHAPLAVAGLLLLVSVGIVTTAQDIARIWT